MHSTYVVEGQMTYFGARSLEARNGRRNIGRHGDAVRLIGRGVEATLPKETTEDRRRPKLGFRGDEMIRARRYAHGLFIVLSLPERVSQRRK